MGCGLICFLFDWTIKSSPPPALFCVYILVCIVVKKHVLYQDVLLLLFYECCEVVNVGVKGLLIVKVNVNVFLFLS